MDVDKPKWPARHFVRIVGGCIAVIAAVAQALTIGALSQGYWWNDSGRPWPPLYVEAGVLALAGWCLAGIGLLLGRYLTPYISIVFPCAAVAGSIWIAFEVLREEGIVYWPPGPARFESMIPLAVMLVFSMFLVGPVTGAWLVGYGMRRHRRSQMLRESTGIFD